MSQATIHYTLGVDRHRELIDLTTDADAALLRLCALLGRLQTLTSELEAVAASIPASTLLGRRMKELTL